MRSVDEYIKVLLDEPYIKMVEMLDSYDNRLDKLKEERPTELSKYKEHMNKLKRFRTSLDSLKFDMSLEVILAKANDDYANDRESWLNEQDSEYAKIDAEVESLKGRIEYENQNHNLELQRANNADNEKFNVLEDKRKILESYSDRIFDICSQYNITSSDLNVSEDMFTVEELDSLYDDYILYMQKEETGSNVISKFRSTVSDTATQGIILLIAIILCYTPVLNVISVVFWALLFANQIMNKNRYKYYSILMAITFGIKPENMGFVQIDESLLLPETLTDDMLDSDDRFSHFEGMYAEVTDRFKSSDPDIEYNKFMSDWSENKSSYEDKLQEYHKNYDGKTFRICSDVDAEIAYCNKQYEELKANWKFIGDRFSDRLVFDSKFVLGLHDDCIEETVDLSDKNVIIRPSSDEKLMTKFLQAMYANAISNVLPGKLKVIIYDPNDFGRSLMPMYSSDISEYMEVINSDLTKSLNALTEYAQNNFKNMSGKTIHDYNARCEETGVTPIEYKLLIILSQPKSVEEDEKLQSFFEYSATGGVLIWVISDSMQSKDAFIFRRPFEGIDNPIVDILTDEWCAKLTANYAEAIKAAKPKGLMWRDFMANILPKEQHWTGSTEKFLDLYPGYLEGDPNLYKPYTVGNEGNVHAVAVGTSGAGKSVFLNMLINTMCCKYDPSQLELWLADFKGSEFITYMNTEDHPYALPHIAACLCTSDPDFGTSLFNAYRNKADDRYADMQYIGVKNLPGWNKKVKTLIGQRKPDDMIEAHKKVPGFNPIWSEDDLWARVLFICDEFQVIFMKADPKNLDKIKADLTQIAKVARACGMHMMFTSQSMKGTVSSDVLANFTLRFALRCEPEVSMDVIHSKRASDIKEANGYLIVQSQEMKTPEDQKRYKTPFLNDGPGSGVETSTELFDNVKYLYERAKKEGYKERDVISYLESTKHPITELDDIYKELKDAGKLPESGVFFLGPRMVYSSNKAPDNIVLGPVNNTNIISVFTDMTDFVLFFNTIVYNIKNNIVPGSIIINSQVADLAYITEAKEYISMPDKFGHILSEKFTVKDMVKWLKRLLQSKKESNTKDKPVWVMLLGWDKGMGFGVDGDMTVKSDLTTILQTCGEYNIHIIFILTGTSGLSNSLQAACKYVIAGKCSVDQSISLIGTKQAGVFREKFTTGWIYNSHDGNISRDKLYISEIKHEITETEIVM